MNDNEPKYILTHNNFFIGKVGFVTQKKFAKILDSKEAIRIKNKFLKKHKIVCKMEPIGE